MLLFRRLLMFLVASGVAVDDAAVGGDRRSFVRFVARLSPTPTEHHLNNSGRSRARQRAPGVTHADSRVVAACLAQHSRLFEVPTYHTHDRRVPTVDKLTAVVESTSTVGRTVTRHPPHRRLSQAHVRVLHPLRGEVRLVLPPLSGAVARRACHGGPDQEHHAQTQREFKR